MSREQRSGIDEGPSSRAGASAVTSDLFLLLVVLLHEGATAVDCGSFVTSIRTYEVCFNLQVQGSIFNSFSLCLDDLSI